MENEYTQVPRGNEKILVVEDEADIATTLEHTLGRERFRVSVAPDGETAIQSCRRDPPDLILLDLMLPDMTGFDLLKVIKRDGRTERSRVIVLTARNEEVDRILGLELGADDYVTKPFSPRELVLRVRSVLQRVDTPPKTQAQRMLSAGPISVDLELHRAAVSGTPLDLTLTEFRLLAELVRAGERVRTRESLLSDVWGYDTDVFSRTVDTHIRRLRRKLGRASSWLATVRGVGYKIQAPEQNG